MSLEVIGAGVGRTGTNSLRIALNQLGFGPCYHMYEALPNIPTALPLWSAALDGRADWPTIFRDYASAVDWPTAGFFRELNAAYPKAKFVLTVRSSQSWAQSFSETIYRSLAEGDQAPAALKPWVDMVKGVVSKTGFPSGLDVSGLASAFEAHTNAVKAAIPADRLMLYEVKHGWPPLCAFLSVPEPAEPFPLTNSRDEFWKVLDAVKAGSN